jgi:hypothetical protein
MGIFDRLFKNTEPKPQPEPEPAMLIAIVLLTNELSFSLQRMVDDYALHYHENIDADGDDIASAFMLQNEQIGLMCIDKPVPSEDIEFTAQYTYTWKTASEDLKAHQAHIIITLMGGNVDAVKRFTLQTQLICSVLRTTDAIGVFNGQQSLLIPKHLYLQQAQQMDATNLPVNLWIYFGLRTQGGLNNGYTYGLEAFGKEEMEILNSAEDIYEVFELLRNTTQYVLLDNVTFKPGETLGFTEQQKIKISYSTGNYVEGNSFKLTF